MDCWDHVSDILRSPCCSASLAPGARHLECRQCGRRFLLTDGIPLLLQESPNRNNTEDEGTPDMAHDGEST